MPSFEYVGVRAILAGINEFRRDTSTYNAAVDSMVAAVNKGAQSAVSNAETQAKAYQRMADSAKKQSADAVRALAKIDEAYAENNRQLVQNLRANETNAAATVKAQEAKMASVVDAQMQVIRGYEREAAAAVAAAEAEVKAAESAARAARARMGAAGGRLPSGAPITESQIPQAAATAQADAANAALKEQQAVLARTQAEWQAYGATVANVTGRNVAEAQASTDAIVSGAEKQLSANRALMVTNDQLYISARQAAAGAVEQAAAEEAAAAKVAANAAIRSRIIQAGATELQAFTAIVVGASEALVAFGKNLLITAGGVAAVAAIIAGLGVKAFADLEAVVASVQGVTDATDQQAKQLSGTILALSRNVGVSIGEISKISQELGRSGFSIDQLNNGLVKQVTLLSQASGGELSYANAAEFVGSAVHQFGIQVSDVGQIIDATAAIAANTTLKFTDITKGFGKAAATGKQFGLTWQQILAIIGETGQILGSGVEAGTNLNQMLTRLKAPGDAAAAGLNKAGIAVYDASGKFRDFRLILQDLSGQYADSTSKLNRMTDAEREHTLSAIFNTRSAREVYILLQQGVGAYDKFTEAINNSTGFAKRAADVMNNTLSAQLQILKNNLTANSIELVQNFIPGLKDLIKAFNQAQGSPEVIKSVQTLGAALSALGTGADLSKVISDIRSLTGTAGSGPELLLKSLQSIGAEFSVLGDQARQFVDTISRLSGGTGIAATGVQVFTDSIQGVQRALEGVLERATRFIEKLRDSGVTATNVRDVLENLVRIGLVGMAAALASLAGPLALTVLKVAALTFALTTLHDLYRDHPVLAAAATLAVVALAAAYQVATHHAELMAAAKVVGWLASIPAPAWLAVAALAALAYMTAQVRDKTKEGNPEYIASLKAQKLALEEAIVSVDKQARTEAEAAANLAKRKEALEQVTATLATQEAASKTYTSTQDDLVKSMIQGTKDMLKGLDVLATDGSKNLGILGGNAVGLANVFDGVTNRILTDAEKIDVALANLARQEAAIQQANVTAYETSSFGGLDEILSADNRAQAGRVQAKKTLDDMTAAQDRYNGSAGAGTQANYSNADSTKKLKDEEEKRITELNREADFYRNAIKTLENFKDQQVEQERQIAEAHAQATAQIKDSYDRQIAAARRAAADQRTEAQRAYTEQRADMITAFEEQKNDRRKAYDQQIADTRAAFEQQKRDLLSQAAFEKGLADEQRAFNEAQDARETSLKQGAQRAKVGDDYNDKLAELTAKTNDRMAIAKTASQKKSLQVSFDLQKKALDRERDASLVDLEQKFKDEQRANELDKQLAAERDAFQEKQSTERAVREEAQRQQTYDRQVAAAQQAFDRQEAAASESLQRQEAAQDKAFQRQLQRIQDTEDRAKAAAKEQADDAIEQEKRRLEEQETKQAAAALKALTELKRNMDDQFAALQAQDAKDVAEAGRVAAAVHADAVQVAKALHDTAVQNAAAFRLPMPPALKIDPFVPAVYHSGRVGLGLGEELARVQASETIMTPTQVSNLVNNAVNVGARMTNSNNSQTINMNPSYSNMQMPGSLMMDFQALMAGSRN